MCVRVYVRAYVRACVVFCHHAHVTVTQNFFYIIVVFAKNILFRSYDIICLPRMPQLHLNQKTDTKGIVGKTLVFAILTKNASFRSYGIIAYPLRAYIHNINMLMYITSAREHELSGRVRTHAYHTVLCI